MIEALLSVAKGTELWDNVPSAIPLFEKIIGRIVNNIQAENSKNISGQLLFYISVGRTKRIFLVIRNNYCYTTRRVFMQENKVNTDVTFILGMVKHHKAHCNTP